MIELASLERRYEGRGGVVDVSLHIPHGSIYVLCGVNGAGKTTTISVLAGLLFTKQGRLRFTSTAGEVRDLPLERYAPRTGFGYVSDQPVLDPALTPWQWLAFASAVKQFPVDAPAAQELATRLVLAEETLRSPIASLSFGNQRKVAIWAEMATTRDLLILDEPLIGLDPIAIQAFHDASRIFVQGGRSILLSTHLLAEAEALATHVGFIHEGRTVREGTLAEICTVGSLREAFLQAASA